jgi:A118 family predicted phage portal protein
LQEIYPGLETELPPINNMDFTFSYFKTPIANNIDMTVPHGISMYANSIDLIRTLQIMLDTYYDEFKYGRVRIMVPDDAIKTVIDPTTNQYTRFFDAKDPVYQGYKAGRNSSEEIKVVTTEIRSDEFEKSINHVLKLISVNCGFDASFLTFDGVSMKTATEIVSEQSNT